MRALALICLAFAGLAYAQDEGASTWNASTFALVEDDLIEPSAQASVGPFGFDFFCHAYGGSTENLMLAITPRSNLSGRWRETSLAGGFDGTVTINAGAQGVGQLESFQESATDRVMVTFPKDQYDLATLLSGERLTFGFEGNGAAPFSLNVDGDNLAPPLCKALSQCSVGVSDICGAFMTIRGANTLARPLSDTLTSGGKPRWFKSEFQPSEAVFPYYRTATVVDPATNSELHLSCLAREGKTLAVHFLQRGEGAPFADGSAEVGDLAWETKGIAGRIANMRPIEQGTGLEFEAWTDGLITRATLETLMTTDDTIRIMSRLGDSLVSAEFTSAGSRDAICAVMKGCSLSLSMSPACTSR